MESEIREKSYFTYLVSSHPVSQKDTFLLPIHCSRGTNNMLLLHQVLDEWQPICTLFLSTFLPFFDLTVFYSHFPHNLARKGSLLLTTYASMFILIMLATLCLLNCFNVDLGHRGPIEMPYKCNIS